MVEAPGCALKMREFFRRRLLETMSRKKISLCREFTFSDKKERSGIEVKRLVKTGFALGLFNDYLLNKEIKERWFFLSTRSLAIVASERIARLIAMKEYDKLSDEIIRQTLEGAEGKEDVGVFRYEDFKDFIY